MALPHIATMMPYVPLLAPLYFDLVRLHTTISNMISSKVAFYSKTIYRFLNVLLSFYGIWNFDFFHFIIPPFYILLRLSKLIDITFLYFISAVNPLFLIAISWICIHLYYQNFNLFVWLWHKLKQNVLVCY